jgi:hypothetical protein
MTSFSRRTAAVMVAAAVGLGLLSAQPDRAKDAAAGQIARVSEITDVQSVIEQSQPPNLVVEVTGVVPTGGWSAVTLLPRESATPPADGIYEYDLVAVRPAGPSIQVLTPVKASHVWKAYPADKVKGVRIYGVGKSVKTVKFGESK